MSGREATIEYERGAETVAVRIYAETGMPVDFTLPRERFGKIEREARSDQELGTLLVEEYLSGREVGLVQRLWKVCRY